MINFLAGLALGTCFAPFWMYIWNSLVKPLISKEVAKIESTNTPPKA